MNRLKIDYKKKDSNESFFCGEDRARTDDLLHAMQAL